MKRGHKRRKHKHKQKGQRSRQRRRGRESQKATEDSRNLPQSSLLPESVLPLGLKAQVFDFVYRTSIKRAEDIEEDSAAELLQHLDKMYRETVKLFLRIKARVSKQALEELLAKNFHITAEESLSAAEFQEGKALLENIYQQLIEETFKYDIPVTVAPNASPVHLSRYPFFALELLTRVKKGLQAKLFRDEIPEQPGAAATYFRETDSLRINLNEFRTKLALSAYKSIIPHEHFHSLQYYLAHLSNDPKILSAVFAGGEVNIFHRRDGPARIVFKDTGQPFVSRYHEISQLRGIAPRLPIALPLTPGETEEVLADESIERVRITYNLAVKRLYAMVQSLGQKGMLERLESSPLKGLLENYRLLPYTRPQMCFTSANRWRCSHEGIFWPPLTRSETKFFDGHQFFRGGIGKISDATFSIDPKAGHSLVSKIRALWFDFAIKIRERLEMYFQQGMSHSQDSVKTLLGQRFASRTEELAIHYFTAEIDTFLVTACGDSATLLYFAPELVDDYARFVEPLLESMEMTEFDSLSPEEQELVLEAEGKTEVPEASYPVTEMAYSLAAESVTSGLKGFGYAAVPPILQEAFMRYLPLRPAQIELLVSTLKLAVLCYEIGFSALFSPVINWLLTAVGLSSTRAQFATLFVSVGVGLLSSLYFGGGIGLFAILQLVTSTLVRMLGSLLGSKAGTFCLSAFKAPAANVSGTAKQRTSEDIKRLFFKDKKLCHYQFTESSRERAAVFFGNESTIHLSDAQIADHIYNAKSYRGFFGRLEDCCGCSDKAKVSLSTASLKQQCC